MLPHSKADKILYKQKLKDLCTTKLRERMDTARKAMEDAQESANNEDKSSAGDKYEVGRAMRQIDRDNYAAQLEEAQFDMGLLQGIDIEKLYSEVTNGAVAAIGDKIYFIATGIGTVSLADQKITVLSPRSPFASALRGKRAGDMIEFNGNHLSVGEVF